MKAMREEAQKHQDKTEWTPNISEPLDQLDSDNQIRDQIIEKGKKIKTQQLANEKKRQKNQSPKTPEKEMKDRSAKKRSKKHKHEIRTRSSKGNKLDQDH